MSNSKKPQKCQRLTERTYDTDGYKLRAGCLCFSDETEKEVLLVTSSKDSSRWIVPAGGIDPGESSAEAAAREVQEEAGAIGKVGRCFGVFENHKSKTRTYIYAMVVKNLIDPVESKGRKWFVIKEALCNLKHRPIQQSYIETALKCKMVKDTKTNTYVNSQTVFRNFIDDS